MINLETLKRKIFLMIGKSLVTLIDNQGKTQTIQVQGLKKESISGIERFQEYGLETYPHTSSESLVVFLNGNRDQGVSIVVHDREHRPKDLEEGDVRVYDSRGNSVSLTSEGVLVEDKEGNKISLKGESIESENKSGTTLKIKGSDIELNGKDDNLVSFTDLQSALSLFTSALNSALATKLDSPGSAGALAIDISEAKIDSLKGP